LCARDIKIKLFSSHTKVDYHHLCLGEREHVENSQNTLYTI
jgi:hypothetical protein